MLCPTGLLSQPCNIRTTVGGVLVSMSGVLIPAYIPVDPVTVDFASLRRHARCTSAGFQ